MSRLADFRRSIWERDGGICGICTLPVALVGFHLDHIVQRAEGGSDDADNLRPTHAYCNQSRERRYWAKQNQEGELIFPVQEVALQTGISSAQLTRWWRSGLLPAYRNGLYGFVYVSPVAAARVLREWAESKERKP